MNTCAPDEERCPHCQLLGEMVYLQAADLWKCQSCGWDSENATNGGNMKDSKFWLVKLTLIIGEYEKTAKHLVEADTKEEAIQQAYRDESHCEEAPYNDDPENEWEDCHGEMTYRVHNIQEVPWDDAVVLRKYL